MGWFWTFFGISYCLQKKLSRFLLPLHLFQHRLEFSNQQNRNVPGGRTPLSQQQIFRQGDYLAENTPYNESIWLQNSSIPHGHSSTSFPPPRLCPDPTQGPQTAAPAPPSWQSGQNSWFCSIRDRKKNLKSQRSKPESSSRGMKGALRLTGEVSPAKHIQNTPDLMERFPSKHTPRFPPWHLHLNSVWALCLFYASSPHTVRK